MAAEQSPALRIGGYRAVRRIGSGATSEVYEAYPERSPVSRPVALKWFRPEMVEIEGAWRRMRDELRILLKLPHPGIVPVLDAGVHEGRPFLVLGLVDGLSLRELLRLADQQGRALSLELALFVTYELAVALAFAHDATDGEGRPAEIVHRDLSPSNILISRTGHVVLTDFGVAWARVRASATAAGFAVGTPGFMAPEQAAGTRGDRRADVFSLGNLLHFAMTRHVLRPDGFRAARSSLPPDVAELVRRATRLLPEERIPDMKSFAGLLWQAYLGRSPPEPRAALAEWQGALRRPAPRAPKLKEVVGELFNEELAASVLPDEGSGFDEKTDVFAEETQLEEGSIETETALVIPVQDL